MAALVVGAALAGCLGQGGADGGSAAPAEASSPGADDGPRNGTDRDRDGANGSDEGGSGTGSNGTADGNATDDGAGADRANATGGPEPGTVVAEGHIQAGAWTSSNFRSTASATDCDVEGVDSFCFFEPPANVTVRTVTETGSPRFNLDIWFHSNETGFVGGCSEGRLSPVGGAGDETNCTVPPEADWGTVDATFGRDLSVELVVQAVDGSG